MTKILITFSNKYAFTFNGNLSKFSKAVINSFTKLDEHANETNTTVEINCGIIDNASIKISIIISGAPNQFLKSKVDETNNFINSLCEIFEKYNISINNEDIALDQLIDKESNFDFDIEKKSEQFTPVSPNYTWENVIIDPEIKKQIENAISLIAYKKQVFEEWGLYAIEPHPSTSLNFYGPSGTGKTLCAEAVAQKLNKKILKVSYSDVESKYHGEGPKMVRAIFHAAEKEDAVLFFDEADSLLSKRLTNVNDGSGQAINSMRSQLLISLENFKGVVIFATNLFDNYDKAFCTRLHNIEFKKPDKTIRESIWKVHLGLNQNNQTHKIHTQQTDGTEKELEIKLNLPLADDVSNDNIKILAKNYEFVGREIRNSVIKACVNVACEKRDKEQNKITFSDIVNACNIVNKEKQSIIQAAKNKVLLKKTQKSQITDPKNENIIEDPNKLERKLSKKNIQEKIDN